LDCKRGDKWPIPTLASSLRAARYGWQASLVCEFPVEITGLGEEAKAARHSAQRGGGLVNLIEFAALLMKTLRLNIQIKSPEKRRTARAFP